MAQYGTSYIPSHMAMSRSEFAGSSTGAHRAQPTASPQRPVPTPPHQQMWSNHHYQHQNQSPTDVAAFLFSPLKFAAPERRRYVSMSSASPRGFGGNAAPGPSPPTRPRPPSSQPASTEKLLVATHHTNKPWSHAPNSAVQHSLLRSINKATSQPFGTHLNNNNIGPNRSPTRQVSLPQTVSSPSASSASLNANEFLRWEQNAAQVFANETDHLAFVQKMFNLPLGLGGGGGGSPELSSTSLPASFNFTREENLILQSPRPQQPMQTTTTASLPRSHNNNNNNATTKKTSLQPRGLPPKPPPLPSGGSTSVSNSTVAKKPTLHKRVKCAANRVKPVSRPIRPMSITSSEGDDSVMFDSDEDEEDDAEDDEDDSTTTTTLASRRSQSVTPSSMTDNFLEEEQLAQLDEDNCPGGEDVLLEVDKLPLYDKEVKGQVLRVTSEIKENDEEFMPRHSIHVVPLIVNPNMHKLDEMGRVAAVIPSLFPNTPPVIRFVTENGRVQPMPQKYKKVLKWRMSTITPLVVKRVVARAGFSATSKCTPSSSLLEKKSRHWIGYFGKHMKAAGFRNILEHQKVNHFPGTFQIGRKDRLYRNLCRQRMQFGRDDYDFFPLTYCLPSDARQLKKIFEDAEEAGTKQKWIVKPPAAARGIGVKVISKWSQVPKRRPTLVQQYIAKPYLIEGSKFDLRVYVYVSSMDPLRIYVHDNGLVRFASQPYSSSFKNLNNRFMHLTNYSVNKKNAQYTSNDDGNACQGHKWTLKSLWSYLGKKGVDTEAIWSRVKDIVVKTIVASDSAVNSQIKMHVRRRGCVHELFGFDVLLDKDLKPWLLEVNISPSLHSNSPLDVQVKSAMISDMFNLAGFQIPPKKCFSKVPLTSSDTVGSSMSISVAGSTGGTRTVPASPLAAHRGSTASRSSSLLRASLSRPHSLEANLVNLSSRSTHASPLSNSNSKAWDATPTTGDNSDSDEESTEEEKENDTGERKRSLPQSKTTNHTASKSSWYADVRLWDKVLTPEEKAKHAYYSQLKPTDKAMLTMMENVTVDDVRILCESVDEWSRAGGFERVFPQAADTGLRYLRYLQQPNRYYNCLLHQFLTKYQHRVDDGVEWLRTLCQHKFHWDKNVEANRWRPPSS